MAPHALIIGAGLGSLALAQSLHSQHISFTIYERSPHPRARPQGYRVRLYEPGLLALKHLLPPHIWDLFEATCTPTDLAEVREWNALTGEPWEGYIMPGHGQDAPWAMTADRTVLRDVLMTGLEQHIHWGKLFTHHTTCEHDGAPVTACFADGTTATGDMLIGADGTRSAVRKQFAPSLKPLDTECRAIFGKTPVTPALLSTIDPRLLKSLAIITERAPHATSPAEKGPTICGILLQHTYWPPSQRQHLATTPTSPPIPQDYIYWVFRAHLSHFPHPTDPSLCALDPPASAALLATSLCAHWAPSLAAITAHADPTSTAVLPILSMATPVPAWQSEPCGRVTLLGDAAHVMSPATTMGASSAFCDASALARVLGRAFGSDDDDDAAADAERRQLSAEDAATGAEQDAERNDSILSAPSANELKPSLPTNNTSTPSPSPTAGDGFDLHTLIARYEHEMRDRVSALIAAGEVRAGLFGQVPLAGAGEVDV